MWDRLLSFFFLILPKSLKFTSSHRRRKLRSFRERRIWSANRNRTRKYRHFNRLRDSGYKSVPKMILILDGVVKTEERIIIWFFFSYPAKKEGERHSFILFLISFFFFFVLCCIKMGMKHKWDSYTSGIWRRIFSYPENLFFFCEKKYNDVISVY